MFGRNSDCDVIFASNKAISGHHCRVWRNADGQVFLEDLSTNGTFVGGEKIGKNKSIPVSSGTEVMRKARPGLEDRHRDTA